MIERIVAVLVIPWWLCAYSGWYLCTRAQGVFAP